VFKDISSILVSISSSDSSLFFMLEPSVAATEELRIELDSESEPDLVSSEVLIVSELELKLIEISIRILRVVSVSLLIYQ
jgi:hypothetical protein